MEQYRPTSPSQTPASLAIRHAETSIGVVPSWFGLAYTCMTISGIIASAALAGSLLALTNGAGFVGLALPAATAVVTLPTFSVLFLKLKRVELGTSMARTHKTRMKCSHFIQFVGFVSSLITLITLMYVVLEAMSGGSGVTIGRAILNAMCVLVACLVLPAYYMLDELKLQNT